MYKLVVFAPRTHSDIIKKELFKIGAGRQGNYDNCCFETVGIGQFRPLKKNNAFIGTTGVNEYVSEVRIEFLIEKSILIDAIKTLKINHPYEEPAYDVIKLENF